MSKPLDRVTLLETFVRIVEAGSISAAARDLGITQPTASRQLAELESRLRTQLVRRTTHALVVTHAGQALLADARGMLDSWEALEERYAADEKEIQGKLSVAAPVSLGQVHLAKMAFRFQMQYPKVSLSWELKDEAINMAESGYDCWIRVGPVQDVGLVVQQVGQVIRKLVASASCVAAHQSPRTAKQIERLPLVALDRYEGRQLTLTKGKKTLELTPQVALSTNNIFAQKEAVLMGLGMAVQPAWFVQQELKRGTLIDLLPDWQAPTLDINIAHLPNRYPPLRLRRFIDHIKAEIART